MAETYPWFQAAEGGDLEQGDILQQFPVIAPPSDLTFPIVESDISVTLRTFDVIVMTQSCDLANDKVNDVILCPHWDLEAIGTLNPALAKLDVQKSILNGYRHRYTMLAASNIENLSLGIRIVDFGQVFSLPKSFVK